MANICKICNYNPHETRIKWYLECISKEDDLHSLKCDNFLLLGDFNSEPTEEAMKSFCQISNFKNLLHKPTCYKNLNNPSYVDLILTNRSKTLQLSQNDPNSTKIIFCKTVTKNIKLPQLQIP